MALSEALSAIVEREKPLAPFTHLRIGGPAEFLVTPRSREELIQVLTHCSSNKVPLHVLGLGAHLLISDAGVRGVVVRLTAPCFAGIQVEGQRVRAGGGAPLAAIIAEVAKHGLTGFEMLVGISATVGGALRFNAGDRAGEMADHVKRVEALDERGQVRVYDRSELHFGDHSSSIEEPVVLNVDFELVKDRPEAIVKRLRRAWITRKAVEPLSFQAAARMFKNPRGYQAAELIDKAGLAKTRSGAAEVSERNGNYVVAHPGATAQDVLQLLTLVQKRVLESSGVHLERELTVW